VDSDDMAKTVLQVRASLCLAFAICLVSHASANIIFGSGPARQPPRRPTAPAPTPRPGAPTCRDPRGQSGSCLPIAQCPPLQPFVRARDVAYLKASLCPRSGGRLLLCCPEAAPPTSPPPTAKPAAFKSPPFCGLTKFGPPGRVVGGQPVQALGDLPWMAALGYSSLSPRFQCGGAVVSKRWIITAAHCILPSGPDTVRVGDRVLGTPLDDDFINPPQTIEVERSIKHPNYVNRRSTPNKGLFNDIALIKLKQPIKFSEVVKPICLPESGDEHTTDREAMVAGWGLTTFAGTRSNEMLYGYLNISRPGACSRLYEHSQVKIDDSLHICANGDDKNNLPPGCTLADFDDSDCRGGVDACGGDSGGPLMSFTQLDNEQFRVKALGLVSFAIGCGDPLHPGVYTRVDTFRDWIGETIANN